MPDGEGNDEMEIDRAANDEPLSSRTDAKGKRSAATLAVEAEDNLPWVEKYRPDSLSEVSGHRDILATIDKFVETNRLPHLLLYGPPGTGKTSTALALARRIYGSQNMRQMVLELNASDDRGIDVVREQIKTFSSTKQIFAGSFDKRAPAADGGGGGGGGGTAQHKLIILDEADAMTSAAQMALRRIMEKYTCNTRFCMLANYTHKLSPALLSRCTRFRFSPLRAPDVRRLVERVVAAEGVQVAADAVDSLVALSQGDMRRALNVLQACHAASTPLRVPGGAEPAPAVAPRDLITTDSIYDCIAAPHPRDVHAVLQTLLTTRDVAACLTAVTALKTAKGLALADLLTALADELARLDVPAQTRVAWLEGLAEIEHRVSAGGSESVQTGGLVAVIRRGVGMMRARG